MDVFVIPIGRDRYELYCEPSVDPDAVVETVPPVGVIGRLWHRFGVLLRAAEERQHRRHDAHAVSEDAEHRGPLKAVQERIFGWIAQRIAEQRLLWHLRRQTSAVAAHPQDMTFDQVMTLIRRTLQRDYERHRVWLVVDTLGLIASGPLMFVPGPNVVAYYFAFRVVGHWLSMRGAAQGLHRVSWSGRPCPPLTELRDVAMLEPPARDARIHDVAARLRLQHLTTFFERVALRHA
jgi:K+-H+ exchange-related protein